MKNVSFITLRIRLLGVLLVCCILGGITACKQPSEAPLPIEPVVEEEEDQKEEEKALPDTPDTPEAPPPAALTGLLIGSPPETLFYGLGQTFDKAGLIVEGVYDDDTSRELGSNEYTLKMPDTGIPGPQRVTVRAGGYTASFPIMVNNSDSVLQSISINAPAGGVVRYLGQTLGTEGFTVTGHYSDGGRPLSVFSVRGYDRAKRRAQAVTLSVNGKTASLPVTVKVPAKAAVSATVLGISGADTVNDRNTAFIKGQPLSLAANRFHATVTCNNVTAVLLSGEGIDVNADISGFNPGQPGKQTLNLNLDEKSVPLEVYVTDMEPQVYFDYGFMRHAGDPGGWGSGRTEGCYHTQPGKTLVLSPVRVLIGYDRDNRDLGVSYSWTVTPRGGSPALSPPSTSGEFLRLSPPSGGSWTVSVTVTGRNYVEGSTISRSAETVVICDTGPLTAGKFPEVTKHFSPGQFTEAGTGYGWSLGAFGGYLIKKVPHQAQYTILGNAFGTWFEPGVVWFQEDQNNNGLPDEMWYELSVGTGPGITRRYSVSFFKYGDGSGRNEHDQIIREIYWADGTGRTGQINGGWPKDWGVSNDDGAWATYTGTLLNSAGEWPNCVDTEQSVFPVNGAIAADNSPVTLTKVAFVKVHTGVLSYGGVFGEISTEINNIDKAW
jgi:hypothetical protein